MKSETTPEARGWATLTDGRRVPLSAAECDAIMADVEARRAKRAADMPDERAALNTLFEAFQRLKELGWSEAIYCPKDGSSFDVIEAGSTGIHRAHYYGEWPRGGWMIEEDGGCPSRPILYRLDPDKEAERRARMAEAAARFRAEMEAENVKR